MRYFGRNGKPGALSASFETVAAFGGRHFAVKPFGPSKGNGGASRGAAVLLTSYQRTSSGPRRASANSSRMPACGERTRTGNLNERHGVFGFTRVLGQGRGATDGETIALCPPEASERQGRRTQRNSQDRRN